MMIQLCVFVSIQLTVPQAWAMVQITTPPDDSAIVGREFVMTCTVTVVRGLTVIPEVVWTGPDGNLTDVENITMGHTQTCGNMTTSSLTLHSLQSHYRGSYSCMAAINIPGLETPPQKSAHKHLAVISTLLLFVYTAEEKINFCVLLGNRDDFTLYRLITLDTECFLFFRPGTHSAEVWTIAALCTVD